MELARAFPLAQRFALLIVLVSMWGCEDKVSTPSDTQNKGAPLERPVSDLQPGAWQESAKHAFETGPASHRLAASAAPGSLTIRKRESNWSFAMNWSAFKVDTVAQPIPPLMASSVDHARVTYHRGALEEWYINDDALEHGFTLEREPGTDATTVEFVFELEEATMTEPIDGANLIMTSRGQSLRYQDLKAFDDNGTILPAEILADGSQTFSIRVDLTDAVYPVVIDPTVILESSTIGEPTAPGTFHHFGSTLATNFQKPGGNDWLIVGSKWSDNYGSDSGALYSFLWDGSQYNFWQAFSIGSSGPQQYMGQGKIEFLKTDVIAHAVSGYDLGTAYEGAVFIFEVAGGGLWAEAAQITEPGGPSVTSYFGRSIDHFGDGTTEWLAVTSSRDPTGRVYVFDVADHKIPALEYEGLAVDDTTEIVGVAVHKEQLAYLEDTSGATPTEWGVNILRRASPGVWNPVSSIAPIAARPPGNEFQSIGDSMEFLTDGNTLVTLFEDLTASEFTANIYEQLTPDVWTLTKQLLIGGGGSKDGGSIEPLGPDSFAVTTTSDELLVIERDYDASADEWGVTTRYNSSTGNMWGEGFGFDPAGGAYVAASEWTTNTGRVYVFPPCAPEICDGIDNDCNGLIDDGTADDDCPATQSCVYGGCFDVCAMTPDCTGETCYTDTVDTVCNDSADPCNGITCAPGTICYSGGCFDACSSDAECDPLNERCYQAGRCGDENDPCAGVFCPVEQVCYGGGCFQTCTDDVECGSISPSHACYDGRCAVDACDGVDCPVGQVCYGGTCFDDCTTDSNCTGACYDAQRCAVDACEGVQCPSSQTCFGGTCFETCTDNGSCTGDCYDGHCANDPCDGVQCGTEEVCHAGSCFTVCDEVTDPCANPDSICYDNRCVDEDDPQCDGVVCRVGETCFQGTCFADCSSGADCTDPNSQCYQDTCISTDCSTVTCLGTQTCFEGVCFETCTGDVDCTETDHVCWEGRCATDPCEALADTDLANYEANSIVKDKDRVVLAYQDSTPWSYPRPVRGTNFTSYVNKAGLSSQAPIHETQKGRVVLYYDEDENGGSYIIWLTHGELGNQSPVEVAYTIRGSGEETGEVYFVDDSDESHQRETDGEHWFIQTLISSEADTTGGIAIGPFEADKDWEMRIIASFSGDILEWELWDDEAQEATDLNFNEALVIKNVDYPGARPFTPTTGQACTLDTEEGVCRRGTRLECRNGWLPCVQTVYPADAEVCDGLDNDCDGLSDNFDDDLEIPQTYLRQDGQFGWRQIATYDSSQTIVELMEYEPRATTTAIRGSSKPKTREGPLIADDLGAATFFVHRSLQSGMLDFAWIAGEEGNTSGSSDIPLIWEIGAFNTSTMDDYGISWYEDRNQNDGERIIQDLENDDRTYEIKHNMEHAFGEWETETDALRMLWNGNDTFVSVDLETNDDDDGGDNFDLRYYQPYYGMTDIHDRRKVRLKVAGTPLDQTICVASSPTAGGCALSRYTCSPAGLLCGAADDAVCNTCVDADGDGAFNNDPVSCPAGDDCDDGNPDIYPGAVELCDGIDNDCDSRADITTNGCPPGMPECGPQECNFALACICPDGPMIDSSVTPCECGAGLTR